MDAFTFLLKTTLFTALVIWGMQYKYGEKTVETHVTEFIQGSTATQPIHKVAEGARRVSSDGWQKFREFVGTSGEEGSQKQSEPQATRKASSFKWQGE